MTILEELLNEIRIIILHLHTKTLTTEFSVFTQSHRCVCVCVCGVSQLELSVERMCRFRKCSYLLCLTGLNVH